MTITSVLLYLHGSDSPLYINDYFENEDDDSGRLIAIGALAAEAIAERKAIHYVTNEGVETIIPFHAITSVNTVKGEAGGEKPENDFCKAMECPTAPMCD